MKEFEVANGTTRTKGVKRSKFGRSEKRKITRVTNRRVNKDDDLTSEKFRHGGEDNSEEDEESEEEYEEEKESIASKRNTTAENQLAYSALVTLLNNKEEDYDENGNEQSSQADDQMESYGGEENAGSDSDGVDFESSAGEEEEEGEDFNEEKEEYLNKYDAFNLHFNEEQKIEDSVNTFRNSKRSIQLLKKKELKGSSGSKYVKLKYGYPEITKSEELESGDNLKTKMKYHNVKQRIQEKFNGIKGIGELDESLIESMLTYETIDFQYYHDSKIKEKYQDYYTLHVLNHIMKTSDFILNNNEKKSKALKQIEEGIIKPEDEPEFRDQGYYRPRALIILPTRNIAWQVVNKLIKNSGVSNVDNKRKFQDQFYDDFKVNRMMKTKKPDDFEEFFDGNAGDFFTLGIKYSRKSMKLYCKLEHSDIIIASPLGLKMIMDKFQNKKNEPEFLSSIELCVIDKAEGLLMQNWQHLSDILGKKLNAPPKNFDGLKIDFSRVRMWAINDLYPFVTQIICFNKYMTPELMSIVKKSKNLISGSSIFKSVEDETVINNFKRGMVKRGLVNKYEALKQTFMRFDIDLSELQNEPNKRFDFFKNVTLPQIMNKSSYNFGTLVYFASYIDYLRVVKYLENETKVSFVAIDEYSSRSKLDRNRALFNSRSSSAKLMLYTERLHFYKRYDIKGVRNVVFYQLPSDPDFYEQVLNFVGDEKVRIEEASKLQRLKGEEEEDSMDLNLCMVRVLFDKLDMMKLDKVVGIKMAHSLQTGDNETYEFH